MDEKRILEIIGEYTTYAPEALKEEMDFVNDLGIDSLDLAQIIMTIEDEYNVELDDEVLDNVETVGDAIEMLKNHH